MKRRFISAVLALCLCASALPAAYAANAPESTAGPVLYADAEIPSGQQVYAALTAMEEQYPVGTPWTNDTPYSGSNPYRWGGGPLGGQNIVAVGCVAFAFKLSDAAFGELPARMFPAGGFAFSDVRVGDILRLDNDVHTVIVLQVSDTGVTIAEGNNNGTVQWGRSLSRAEVEAASHYITRYPEGYVDPGDSSGSESAASGTVGTLSWTLTRAGTLTISGSGAIPDFSGPSEQPWNDHADKILKIVIENGVTSIGNGAFYNSKALSVTIANSVTAIGSSAFYGSSLISADIPSSVKTIGDDAFRSCANLASVTVSEGVETIGQRAFRGCQKLGSIVLPASVASVGAGAFYDCVELASAVFTPSSKQVALGDDLFARCWRLRTVTLPRNLDRISERMFQNCYAALSSLDIPQGTASIGDSAFASCSCLTVLTVPDSVTSIGMAAFSACNALRDIYFGGSEAQWNSIQMNSTVSDSLANVTTHYNAAGTSPDPGTDPNPGTDPDPGTAPDPGTDPTPTHTHSWAEEWSSNESYHWHECTAPACPVTVDSQKDGCAAHVYGSNLDTVCKICGYIRTVSSGTPSPSGPVSGGPSGTPGTSAVRNPDGSTTTRTEDKSTGTITETTRNPDGSRTVVETRKDGTVITTVERTDGVTTVVTTGTSGMTAAEVTLPAAVVSEARRSGEAVLLPIDAVQAPHNTAGAPAITVHTGSREPVKVEILLENAAPGVVAVLVHADGSEETVIATVPTERGIAVSLPDGATLKIVDNGKRFPDVPASHWANGAVAFVSARGLFSGVSADAFSPDAPMTRAMLMTVMARYAGEETGGGAVWYENGMAWAVANAISDGSDPDGSVTREQLATALWRYAGSPAAGDLPDAFADAWEISEYAREAMRWAVGKGIINGLDDGRLAPADQATRAEVAAMIMRYACIA